MAIITLYELSNYNNGVLCAETFNIDDITSQDEFTDLICDWLETLSKSHKEKGIYEYDADTYEEWRIGEVEGIPDAFVSLDFNVESWVVYRNACNDMGKKIVEAYINIFGDLLYSDQVRERYVGYFETFIELGRYLLDKKDSFKELSDHTLHHINIESYVLGLLNCDRLHKDDNYYFWNS